MDSDLMLQTWQDRSGESHSEWELFATLEFAQIRLEVLNQHSGQSSLKLTSAVILKVAEMPLCEAKTQQPQRENDDERRTLDLRGRHHRR